MINTPRRDLEAFQRKLQKNPVTSLILCCLSLVYYLIVTSRRILYKIGFLKPKRLPGTVISIGNVVAGGSGKTPSCIDLARQLVKRGYRVAVLTRGYKSGMAQDEWLYLKSGQIAGGEYRTLDLMLDEPKLMSHKLPMVDVVVGRQRYEAACAFMKIHEAGGSPVQIWIIDDGFQHFGIHRDHDVVLVDSSRLDDHPDNWLIPYGKKRERLGSLKRADFIVDFGPCTQQLASRYQLTDRMLEGQHRYQKIEVLGQAASRPLNGDLPGVAMCAIANPERFLRSIKALNLELVSNLVKADHDLFNQEDIDQLGGLNSAWVMITEKDFWRQPEFWEAQELVVTVLSGGVVVDWSLIFSTLPDGK